MITQPSKSINIVFVLFPQITQLDFTGPAEVFSRMPGARLYAAAKTSAPIPTDSGFSILPNTLFPSCPKADVLCVPGGPGVRSAVLEPAVIDFVTSQGHSATWTTSVCTGAFILGGSGLLKGKHATTHWAYTHLLPYVGARYEPSRIVVDGNVVTAGGVTSGIDFALALIARIATPAVAQQIQLELEYDPAPPYQCGHPTDANSNLVDELRTNRYERAAARLEDALTQVTIRSAHET